MISKAKAEHIATKIAKWYRPKSDMLYSGKNDDQVYFEIHIERMERILDGIPDITDSIKLEELEYWFSGMAGTIVRNLAVGEDDTERLATAKNILRKHFNGKQKKTWQSLEKLEEGEPFAKSDIEGIRGLLINLLTTYNRAERMGSSWMFGRASTYHGLLRNKLPHMVTKWVKKFGNEKDGDLNFLDFHKFVCLRMRIDETASIIRQSTSQSEDRDPRDVFTSVRSRSDSGLLEGVSGEDSDKATDAGLPVTGQRGTTRVCGCPLCGDAHLLMRCQRFLRKAPIQRWKFCKQERLCLRCLGGDHFSKHCRHMSCSECGGAHHSLLHRGKRTYSSCSGLSESDYL